MMRRAPCETSPADTDAPRPCLEPRHGFIHARVVLHRARAQRIHAQIDRVVPRRKPREVADDLDLAQLRHDAQIGTRRMCPAAFAASTAGTSSGGQPIGFLPRRRLLKDQSSFWLTWCVAFLMSRLISSLIGPPPALPRQSVLCVFSSVQHHSDAFPSSG